jgi:hypothetical protein
VVEPVMPAPMIDTLFCIYLLLLLWNNELLLAKLLDNLSLDLRSSVSKYQKTGGEAEACTNYFQTSPF